MVVGYLKNRGDDVMIYTKDEKIWLLDKARDSIISFLDKKDIKKMEISDIPTPFTKKNGTFVTLNKNGDLRGCIGYIFPQNIIYKDIVSNAQNAAFRDPRFPAVKKDELDKIDIEISILTTPERLNYENRDDLLSKIDSSMGLILKKGYYQSTFLPQVWESLPDPIQFLTHLSLKAGLSADDWENCEFHFYKNIHFNESDFKK